MTEALRIASLISSGTEILCRLGLESSLVAISHECDYPPSILKKGLPVLSAPKINPNKTSKEIDRDVRALVRDGLSVYEVHADILEKVAPDIIITQDQCHVCAVSLKDVEQAVCQVTKKPTEICSLVPHTLDDIVDDFRKVGRAVHRENEAEELVTEFWIRLNALNARAGTKGKPKQKILCIEWLEPTIIAGGWMPEIVKLAGGEPLIVSEPEKFKTVTWEEARASEPDVIAIMPCGYNMEKTLGELMAPDAKEELGKFKAVKNGKCFVCDGNAYFNRPGPRIADSTEILAAITYPEKFPDHLKTYRGKAYQLWQP